MTIKEEVLEEVEGSIPGRKFYAWEKIIVPKAISLTLQKVEKLIDEWHGKQWGKLSESDLKELKYAIKDENE